MNQEDKKLLLADLCARLPYHIRLKVWLKDGTTEEGVLDLEHNYGDVLRDAFYYNEIIDIKPYLRPMSSMTEEEKDIVCSMNELSNKELDDRIKFCSIYMQNYTQETFDYLNSIHIDYRGLIKKGLALEAPTGMYK